MAYPPLSPRHDQRKQQRLHSALQNRLEAIAKESGKSPHDARVTKLKIFCELGFEQAKLVPRSIASQRRIEGENRKWKAGKEPYGPSIAPDFAASLVRMAFLRRGIRSRRYSEEQAISESKGVTRDQLTAVERRATDIVLGLRRSPRGKPHDRAAQIAKEVLATWFPPVPPFQPKHPDDARSLSIDAVVRIALPFLDELAGRPIRGGTPDNDHDPASMEPPGLGALVAFSRMAHPKASVEYICDLILAHRRELRVSSR
jgi:hypothetical protein